MMAEPETDVALREIRTYRAACYRLLRSRPTPDMTDSVLDEIARLGRLEARQLDEHGTDAF